MATLSTIPIERERIEDYSELAALVRQARDGDREAFGLLVEQFERTVHAICLRRLLRLPKKDINSLPSKTRWKNCAWNAKTWSAPQKAFLHLRKDKKETAKKTRLTRNE